MKRFIAKQFDLSKGHVTGREMEFLANNMHEAAEHLAYTLNLKSRGWKVGPSGRTVQRMGGDIGWHLTEMRSHENPVKAGGISLETGLLIAGGVALLGGIGYLIYNAVQQANATAAATNAQLAQTNATGQQLAATAQQAQQLLPGSSSTLPYYAIPGTPPAVQAAGNQAAAASVGL
ncbi:MAG: hypothetical protein ACLP1X_27100 [Polyangiaceae bacterium]